ncbi:MAG: hypothetical protein JWL86_2850 [Rhizobium sp.]|nr:hypothetical protein [Rhizobium sp.]
MDNINQADGAGQIDVGGKISSVSYHVIAKNADDGAGKRVHIELSLPRDWLVAHGFEKEAVLIRENGARTAVRADSLVDVEAPLSIILASEAEVISSENELGSAFPELSTH